MSTSPQLAEIAGEPLETRAVERRERSGVMSQEAIRRHARTRYVGHGEQRLAGGAHGGAIQLSEAAGELATNAMQRRRPQPAVRAQPLRDLPTERSRHDPHLPPKGRRVYGGGV